MILPALVDWHRLTRYADVFKLTRGGCEWVSFASITECLQSGQGEDLALPNNEASNHAGRVASLVRLLRAGVELDPLQLHVVSAAPVPHAPRRRLELWFEDGSHRFRAYEFLGYREPLAVLLQGEGRQVADLLSVAGEGIVPLTPLALA